MDWKQGIQNAIDYIEENLDQDLEYEKIAAQSYCSRYHFHRVFGAVCGCTVGEYIRKRRLTLAAKELAQGKAKVLDVALKYGYESPDSFTKAFLRFHGALPSQAKKCQASLKAFPPFTMQNLKNEVGRYEMNYKIEERKGLTLVGFKRRFQGVPYGEERKKQEEEFFCATRGKQWLLRGASNNPELEYCLITNVDEEGYDFYIASEVDEWERKALFDPKIMGINVEKLDFEVIELQPQTYAVFETEKQRKPIREYMDIRQRIVGEWLLSSGYTLKDAPELVILHWKYYTDRDRKYVEICLPIE